jgi:tetratricopeptide (TPR) repeat protein
MQEASHVVFKKIFGGGGGEKLPEKLDIDDLIVLERYPEAEERLRTKLQAAPNDLHSHVKLAEVFTALRKVDSAVQEYLFAADEYADDGFYDKAIALLAKAAKLAPADPTLAQRLERFEELKRVEQSRAMAIEGLMTARRDSGERPSVLAAQQIWFDLQASPLIKRLNADQLKRLFGAVTIVKADSGDVLAKRGMTDPALYIVARGEVEALWETAARRMALRTFGAGDIFGESTLFERQSWPASYYASSLATLLRLDKVGLEQALQGNTDPVGLLEVLRGTRSDRDVAATIEKLGI